MTINPSDTSRLAASARPAARASTRRASLTDNGPSRFQSLLNRATSAGAARPAATAATTAATTAAPAAPATVAAATQAQTTNVFGLQTVQPKTPAVVTKDDAVPDDHPTAESVFGANPWMASPGGYSSAGSYSYNPMYFATEETAQKVAQMLGGTVVAKNAIVGDTGPFFQQQPNYMVQLPNGHLVNAGLTATYFTHGWSQSFIDVQLGYDRNV